MSKKTVVDKWSIKKIVENVYWEYNDYYCTCIYEIVVDAVANTIDDFKSYGIIQYTLEDVHKHITENYI